MKWYRMKKGKVFGGVCAGIADYYKLNVTFVRIVTFLLVLFSGAGALAYIILSAFLPDKFVVEKEEKERRGE